MIPIYIGTEEAQQLPTEVLKHSILSRTQQSVEFVEMNRIASKLQQKMYTGFSFYRFSVPEQMHFQGRAIYLDADIISLCDINELFTLDMGEHKVLARIRGEERPVQRRYTSVLLFQCDRLTHWKWDRLCEEANAAEAAYKAMMWAKPDCPYYGDYGDLPPPFNHLNQYDERTKILHYTHVKFQPWKNSSHPLAYLWIKELRRALDAGFIAQAQIEEEIARHHIRPTVLDEVLAIKA